MAGLGLSPNVLLLIPIAVGMFMLGLLVLRSNPLSKVNKIFFVLTSVVIVGWIVADMAWLSYIAQYHDYTGSFSITHQIRYYNELQYFFNVWVCPIFLHLALEMMGALKGRDQRPALAAIYALPVTHIILMLYTWSAGVVGINEAIRIEDGSWYSTTGWLFYAFNIPYSYITVSLAYVVLLRGIVRPTSVLQRLQATAFMLGSVPALIGNVLSVTEINPTRGTAFYMDPTLLGFIGTIIVYSYAIKRYGMFRIEAVLEETAVAGEKEMELEKGRSYLFLTTDKAIPYMGFRMMTAKHPGLCITIDYPSKVRGRFELERTPVIWLTEITTDQKAFNPWRLDFEVFYTIKTFMQENDDTVVMLDGINYVFPVVGQEKVLDFVRTVNDVASTTNATLAVIVDPRIISERERTILSGMFDEVVEGGAVVSEPRGDTGFNRMIIAENPDAAYQSMAGFVEGRNALYLSSTHPEKLRKRFQIDPGSKVVWLSRLEADGTIIDPGRMEFEGLQLILDFYGDNGGGTVVLDDLPSLLGELGTTNALALVKTISDHASQSGGALLLSVLRGSIEEADMALFQSLFDRVEEQG